MFSLILQKTVISTTEDTGLFSLALKYTKTRTTIPMISTILAAVMNPLQTLLHARCEGINRGMN